MPSVVVPTVRIKKKKTKKTKSADPVVQMAQQPDKKPFADAGKVIGTSIARFLGLPEKGGAGVGRGLGSAIGSLFGSGDYRPEDVRVNSLIKPVGDDNKFADLNSSRRGVRYSGREYIGDVVSSSTANTFAFTNYELNPGLVATFPNLAWIARLFEQYEFHGLLFEFRSTSADNNGTTQALGSITMATVYDAIDPSYASKQEMSNTDYSSSCKASENMIQGIECDPAERPTKVLFTRVGSPPAGTDKRLYDLGRTTIASSGVAGTNVVLGEMWVSYDVTFFKRQTNSYNWDSAKIVNASPTSRTNWLNATSVVTGVLPISISGKTITFLTPGKFLLEFVLAGTVFTSNPGTTTASTAGVVNLNVTRDAAATGEELTYSVNVTQVGQTFDWDMTVACTTVTSVILRIAGYDTALA